MLEEEKLGEGREKRTNEKKKKREKKNKPQGGGWPLEWSPVGGSHRKVCRSDTDVEEGMGPKEEREGWGNRIGDFGRERKREIVEKFKQKNWN